MTETYASEPPAAVPAIFVVGEALIDIVVRPSGREEHPGGSPMNVAYGLGRLGVPTTLRSVIGRDARGDRIRRHLAESGVELDAASVTDAPTSTALAEIQPDGHAEYTFDIAWNPGAIAAPSGIALAHTGSIAAVLRPGAADVRRLFGAIADTALLSFDPNVRPALAGDRDAAFETIAAVAARAHVVKMSDEDAEWLHPDLALEDVLDHYLEAGTGIVAVTRGADGCLVASPRARLALPSIPVDVIDTIGAGDAFMSGLLSGVLDLDLIGAVRERRLEADGLRAVADQALASARVTVSRAGANPPTRAELRAALAAH
jgi:fructokinase